MYKIILATLFLASPLAAAVPQSQRDALIAIYDATEGDNWNNRQGWKGATGTECNWYGVTCNAAGDSVTVLSLEGNNLRGTLPTAIGQLTNLLTLNGEKVPEGRMRGAQIRTSPYRA